MEAQTEAVAKKQSGKKLRRFFSNFSKLILDATKLIFASLVLGTIIRGDFPQSTVLFWGIIASGIGAIMGLVLLTIFEEK